MNRFQLPNYNEPEEIELGYILVNQDSGEVITEFGEYITEDSKAIEAAKAAAHQIAAYEATENDYDTATIQMVLVTTYAGDDLEHYLPVRTFKATYGKYEIEEVK